MIPGFDATHAETSAAFDDALSVGALDGLGASDIDEVAARAWLGCTVGMLAS